MNDDFLQLHAAENARRERCADPAARWEAILAMIAWAQEQLPPEQRRNSPAVCKRIEVSRLPTGTGTNLL